MIVKICKNLYPETHFLTFFAPAAPLQATFFVKKLAGNSPKQEIIKSVRHAQVSICKGNTQRFVELYVSKNMNNN